ncbi:hypothetical protein KC331_g9757 [Hortaea werneckii]|nr:hypothetical protein KC331_g9757 [Hortaea werneckii]KAI7717193.1 hypothetical protein KC353_g4770 [Hortaea werneckii]
MFPSKYGTMARLLRVLSALVAAGLLLTHLRWFWASSTDSKFKHQSLVSGFSNYDHNNRLSNEQFGGLATHQGASGNLAGKFEDAFIAVPVRDASYSEDNEREHEDLSEWQNWLTSEQRNLDFSFEDNQLLQTLDTSKPDLNRRFDEQLVWDQAVKKGNILVALMNGPVDCVEQSQWTNMDDLATNGWTQEVNRAYRLKEPFKSIWSELGISHTDVKRIEWKHSKSSAPIGPGGMIYEPTGAMYENIYCKEIIIADHNFGPDNRGGEKSPPMVGSEIIPLKQWSDVTFIQYQDYCKQHETTTSTSEACLRGLRGVIRANVVGAKTREIANEALSQSGRLLRGWDHRATWAIEEESAQAILATPNGLGVAWFLAQHKAQLGHKIVTENAVLSCPRSDNILYTATSGRTYTVECNTDHQSGDLASVHANNLLACIESCDSTDGCVDVSLSGSACYMKSVLGRSLSALGLSGARLNVASPTPGATAIAPSPECPESNNTLFKAPNGAEFAIECGIDHAAGDIGMVYVRNLGECAVRCSETSGCVDVSLSGAACYLKSDLGPTSYNAAINGARLVSQPSGTVSLSVGSGQATTASVATPTSTRLSCPASNGTYYTASSGMVFVIDCDTDYPGGDMDSVKATSLEECIEACDDEVSCSALVLSGVGCYQKYQANTPTRARGMLAARLVEAIPPSASSPVTSAPAATTRPGATPLCPANNGFIYTSENGKEFVIECFIDHPGGNLDMVEMTGAGNTWFAQCIETCATHPGCLDVSLSGAACYLKSTLNPPTSADGIRGARLRSSGSTTSAVSSAMVSETPTAYPAPDDFVGTFEYLACYNDSVTNRTLQGAYLFGTSLQNLTLERCATFCDDFQYFGVEYAQECYCGSQLLNNAIQQDSSSCSAPCAGDETQNCGGYNRISVYRNRNFTAVVSSTFSGISSTPVATSAIVSPSSSFDASGVTAEPTMSGPTTSEAGSPTPSPLSSVTITTSESPFTEGFPTLLPSPNNTGSPSNTVILGSDAAELLSSSYFSNQMSSSTSVTLGYNSTGLSTSVNVSVTPTSMLAGSESVLGQSTASLSIPSETGLSEVTSFATPSDSTTSFDGTNSPSSTMNAWTYANTTFTSVPSELNTTSGSSTLAILPSAFTPGVSVVITSSDTELSHSSEAFLQSSEATIVPESESTQTLITTGMSAATSTSTEPELSSSSDNVSSSPSAFVSSSETVNSSSEDLVSSTPSAAPVSVTTVEITRTVTNIGTVTVIPIEASAFEDDLSTQEATSTIFEISTSTVVPIAESAEPQLSFSDEETSTIVNLRTFTVVPVEASTSTEQVTPDGSADSEITSITATTSTAAEAESTTEDSISDDANATAPFRLRRRKPRY